MRMPRFFAELLQVAAVAAAEGVPGLETELLIQTVLQVVHATANNFSSMHQDVAHKRTTEIAYINGFVVNRAAAHSIDVAVNAALTAMIQLKEQDYC
jgi:2-dehydropantoate 2-reductase